MDGLLQVAVVLNRLVEVGHSSLEYVLDDALDDDVLLCREFGVVVVANCFQDDVLLELLLVVVLLRVNADLLVDRSQLSLWELGPAPETSVQFTAFLALGTSMALLW